MSGAGMSMGGGGHAGMSLSRLNRAIAGLLNVPGLANVWVVAELMDVRVSRGHCYMELVEKNGESGTVVARMRGTVWASNFGRLREKFRAATGRDFSTGLKVLVCGTVTYHAAYGMSLVISDVDGSYTMGEAERRRREILLRLKREGIMEDNRRLEWPDVALRVAVISAPGAAGYGDFVHQLYSNGSGLRFVTGLFPALMQGEGTVRTVTEALDRVAMEADEWDCVVIIRGGGASSDLQAFDDYTLAASVAQFPLPVIVGIGHERDVTVLDYVANMRVKTPTAAAEWLVGHGEAVLERLRRLGSEVYRLASERLGGARVQLAHLESGVGVAPGGVLERARVRLDGALMGLGAVCGRRISPERARLDAAGEALCVGVRGFLRRCGEGLERRGELVRVLGPQATLERGYSITMCGGRAVRSVEELVSGAEVTTVLADGERTYTIKKMI